MLAVLLALASPRPRRAQPPDPAATIARYEALYRRLGQCGPALADRRGSCRARAIAPRPSPLWSASRRPDRLFGSADFAPRPLRRRSGFRSDLGAARGGGAAGCGGGGRSRSSRAPGLVPEGIAADPASGRLFLGDMNNRRIWAIGRDGRARPLRRTARSAPARHEGGRRARACCGSRPPTPSGPRSRPAHGSSRSISRAEQCAARRPARRGRSTISLSPPTARSIATDSLAGAVYRLDPGSDSWCGSRPTRR